MTKYRVNKCDDKGNIITGYEQIMTGTQQEVEADYRCYYEYDGAVLIDVI